VTLFIAREKQADFTPYGHELRDGVLTIDGETSHANDRRLVRAAAAGDEVHRFDRERHHAPFVYPGRAHLAAHELRAGAPSRFEFVVGRSLTRPPTASRRVAHPRRRRWTDNVDEDDLGGAVDGFTPDPEGVAGASAGPSTYERSLRNRARALADPRHGVPACGFDFNARYGARTRRRPLRCTTCGRSRPAPRRRTRTPT
jgi:hypothetical protein